MSFRLPPPFIGPLPDPEQAPPLPRLLPVGVLFDVPPSMWLQTRMPTAPPLEPPSDLQPFKDAFSLLSKGGECADLRHLPADALAWLPDGWLTGLRKCVSGNPSGLSFRPPRCVALPVGCTASTVNRFLRELEVEFLSAPGILADEPVDLGPARRLRLFQSDQWLWPWSNDRCTPVARRPIAGPPVFLQGDAPPLFPRETLSALRAALCEDDVDLLLPSRYGFMQRQNDLEIVKDRARRGLPLDERDRQRLHLALRMVPRELLPAHAGVALFQTERDIAGTRAGAALDARALRRMQRLFDDQLDIAHPRRSASPQALREQRSARDLVTLARALRWAIPDVDYLEAQPLRDTQKGRLRALRQLLTAWDRREDLQPALDQFRALDIAPPGEDLLTRMRVASQPVLFRHPHR